MKTNRQYANLGCVMRSGRTQAVLVLEKENQSRRQA
jgi:hypothetical protein